ncbi:MacB family efflux pump subunit [Gallaecimonas xiamenensis]|uniref:ABC transporter-like protein n=1 Tax=Gallaecimonas xiamenensis 3-C-1 TaxID=745411 RepID=K2J6K8_9GAMM|nr:MacB family efflux pump subunit [Gallaecimonas xiamenensis]EKE70572.1 ABC transporter-like protein [Gallaecimonas xiamenensis 3-C-1]
MAALLELKGITRSFPSGDEEVAVLKDVDLCIEAGEMVAIVGQSGSGKSTLMNILGCLDKPSRGQYKVAGQDLGQMDNDALATLRREYFGFIFQRYHLLPHLDATGNVEMPAIYAGTPKAERTARAMTLLARLGLGDRSHHKPGQLSGGQQQRVSIARALMNGGEVILADEPTGALDSHSGAEVLAILKELHQQGQTIIIVTHDMEVAAIAERIIEIKDGEIIADRRNEAAPAKAAQHQAKAERRWFGLWGRFSEALKMAGLAMASHRMRTLLTMLGIIIGITAVVSVVAVGQGAKEKVIQDINAIGTNTIDIYPGSGWGDRFANSVQTLVPSDLEALQAQVFIDSATPNVSTNVKARYGNVDSSATVRGVSEQYFQVEGMTMAQGQALGRDDIRSLAQVAIIDKNTQKTLFTQGQDPIGQVIILGKVPYKVIGVAEDKDSAFRFDQNLQIYVPYTAVMSRMLSQHYFSSLTVRVADGVSSKLAEEGITKLLSQRHGSKDFFTRSSDSILQAVQKTTSTMTLLVSSIAVISLVVGGIGVMNIMLVSVTERTREIGIRMAVGARQADILQQFLIEAVLVCLAGGSIGVALSLGLGLLANASGGALPMSFSVASIVGAFVCSSLIGVVFGFLPARNAAKLDPIEALARE